MGKLENLAHPADKKIAEGKLISLHYKKLDKGDIVLKTASEIAAHPKFVELRQTRRRFAWIMTAIIFVVYFSYVLVMAYAPDWLAQKIDPLHATSVGLPIGAGVILFAFAMTLIYTRRANKEFESLTAELKKDLTE